jgi:hypothetical protein
MNNKKDGAFDIICALVLLFSSAVFENALPIVIISIVMLLYGIFRACRKKN